MRFAILAPAVKCGNGYCLSRNNDCWKRSGCLLKDPSVATQQQLTRDWWALAPQRLEVVVSQLVLDECGGGDPSAAQERLVVIKDLRLLAITQECRDLATDLM